MMRPAEAILPLVLLILAGCSAAPSVAPSTSPARVQAMIDAPGASMVGVVRALNAGPSPTAFDVAMAGVAAGDPDWLALFPAINSGVDDATALPAGIAISDALQHNPNTVLAILPAGGDIVSVCSDNRAGQTPQARARWFAATIAAVEALNNPDLTENRTACLSALRASQAAS